MRIYRQGLFKNVAAVQERYDAYLNGTIGVELIQGKMLQYLKYEHDFVNLSYFSKEHLKENMAFRSTCKEEAEKKRQTKANATLSKQSADEIINIKACISAFWKGYIYGQDIPLSVEYGATMEKENNILSKMYSVMQHQTGYDAWLFQSGHWDLRDISVDLYVTNSPHPLRFLLTREH